uniref:Clathrin_bdg domain-containing protein n=1 Tax=Macrostomum lignano TaxID=282301 RepID=A0A1I8HBU8_9PLAT
VRVETDDLNANSVAGAEIQPEELEATDEANNEIKVEAEVKIELETEPEVKAQTDEDGRTAIKTESVELGTVDELRNVEKPEAKAEVKTESKEPEAISESKEKVELKSNVEFPTEPELEPVPGQDSEVQPETVADFNDIEFEADFAAFETAADGEEQTNDSNDQCLQENEVDADDADWAEFADPPAADAVNDKPPTVSAVSEVSGDGNVNDDDFGEDDDDFGDFEEFQGAQPISSERRLNKLCADLRAALDKLLADALGAASEEVDDVDNDADSDEVDLNIDSQRLEQLLQAESTAQLEDVKAIVSQAASSHPTTTNVWSNLMDLENSPTVKYQWSQSVFYEESLKALHIDVRNLLNSRKHAYQIFAGQLGLLEPTPVTPAASGGNDEAATGPAAAAATSAGVTGEAPAEPSDPSGATSAGGPELQFDWNSSGLTNPLDKLEAEFLDNGGGGSATGRPDKKLSSLISAAQPSAPVPAAALSDRARKFIKRLPDLSYMRAKVLMFPMHRSNSESSLPVTDESP